MLSPKEWLVLLAGIKGAAGSSVAPLFVTALYLRLLRTGAIAVRLWFVVGSLSLVLVFGFFGFVAVMLMAERFLRPESRIFPEGYIALAGSALTHAVCLVLIVSERMRARSIRAVSGHAFEVLR